MKIQYCNKYDVIKEIDVITYENELGLKKKYFDFGHKVMKQKEQLSKKEWLADITPDLVLIDYIFYDRSSQKWKQDLKSMEINEFIAKYKI